MLNQNLQQDNSGTTSSASASPATADNVRVTTEEFVAAINRIDARRAQESAQINGTVAIGQTLQDLHVDASAEEVLREIEQIRKETALDVKPVTVDKPAVKETSVSSATAVELAAKEQKRVRRRRNWLRVWAGLAIFTLGGFAGYAIDESNSPDIAGLHSLSMMQSGQELFVTTDSVEKLIAGGAGQSVLASTLGEARAGGSYNWPVLMKNGQLYVLAYTDPSQQAAKSGTLDLHNYSTDDGPSKSQAITTIPIVGTAIVSTNEDDSDSPEITVQRSAEAGTTPQAK